MSVQINLTQLQISTDKFDFNCSGTAEVNHDNHTHTFKFDNLNGGFFSRISKTNDFQPQITYFLKNIAGLKEVTPNLNRLDCCNKALEEFKAKLEDELELKHGPE